MGAIYQLQRFAIRTQAAMIPRHNVRINLIFSPACRCCDGADCSCRTRTRCSQATGHQEDSPQQRACPSCSCPDSGTVRSLPGNMHTS